MGLYLCASVAITCSPSPTSVVLFHRPHTVFVLPFISPHPFVFLPALQLIILEDYADPFDAEQAGSTQTGTEKVTPENDGYMEPYEAQKMMAGRSTLRVWVCQRASRGGFGLMSLLSLHHVRCCVDYIFLQRALAICFQAGNYRRGSTGPRLLEHDRCSGAEMRRVSSRMSNHFQQ